MSFTEEVRKIVGMNPEQRQAYAMDLAKRGIPPPDPMNLQKAGSMIAELERATAGGKTLDMAFPQQAPVGAVASSSAVPPQPNQAMPMPPQAGGTPMPSSASPPPMTPMNPQNAQAVNNNLGVTKGFNPYLAE